MASKGYREVWHGPMRDRYADARHPRKLHARLPCRTIESETRTMRINNGGHAARIEPRRRGLSDEITEGSTVVRLTGRATGSHAQAALPKPIRLFDKVT